MTQYDGRGVIMSHDLAALTVDRYVCARCWCRLQEYFGSGQVWVACSNIDCDGDGFVTAYYADRQREYSVTDKREVSVMLHELGIVQDPNANKSTQELLRELGF